MLEDMPVGIPIYEEGEYLIFNDEYFGFIYADIISPKNLKFPFLVKRFAGENYQLLGT